MNLKHIAKSVNSGSIFNHLLHSTKQRSRDKTINYSKERSLEEPGPVDPLLDAQLSQTSNESCLYNSVLRVPPPFSPRALNLEIDLLPTPACCQLIVFITEYGIGNTRYGLWLDHTRYIITCFLIGLSLASLPLSRFISDFLNYCFVNAVTFQHVFFFRRVG